jgi:hypothetical protein
LNVGVVVVVPALLLLAVLDARTHGHGAMPVLMKTLLSRQFIISSAEFIANKKAAQAGEEARAI